MAVPNALQSQIDQAEQLQANLYPADPVESEGTPPETPPVAAVPPPATSQTAEVIELAQKPAEPAKPETPEDVRYWKARFETLQGKFNAEVPALHRQLKEQSTELQSMRTLLEELKTRTPEPIPAKQEALVSEADVEAFGADLVQMTHRVSQATVKAEVEKAVAEVYKKFGVIEEKVGQATATAEQTATARFWGEVATLVPDWAEVDTNPEFIAFLDSTPDFSERTYREMAGEAIQNGKPAKIAKLVELWRGKLPEPPVPTPPAVPNSQAELQRQVAPSSSRASTPAPQGERFWNRADYEAAYDVRNVKRYGEKRAAEMIAEADRAVAEGRVRW